MKPVFLPALVLPAALALCGCLSCSMDPAVVTLWGGDASPPSLETLSVLSATRIEISFSGPVEVAAARVRLDASGEELGATWSPSDSADAVYFDFAEPVTVGKRAVIDASVADGAGNTLSFAVPFTGYNERPARLSINEIRVDYSKPKAEYVEFLVLEAGNLSGIEIVNARNAKVPSVELPAVEVAAGEYVVWHLRSVDEGLVTELGAADESAGVDSNPSARDIWDTQTSAPLKATNVLLVRDRLNGALQDALLTAEASFADWPTEACRKAAEEAVAAGLWSAGASVSAAVPSDGTSPTRTLGKTVPAGSPGEGSAAVWAVCPTGKCSPGRDNWAP